MLGNRQGSLRSQRNVPDQQFDMGNDVCRIRLLHLLSFLKYPEIIREDFWSSPNSQDRRLAAPNFRQLRGLTIGAIRNRICLI